MSDAQKFRFYMGKPVKRMRRIGDGKLLLTFLSSIKGKPGTQLTVTEADWQQHGRWETVEGNTVDDVRKLVRT